jgi:hypothetical protein
MRINILVPFLTAVIVLNSCSSNQEKIHSEEQTISRNDTLPAHHKPGNFGTTILPGFNNLIIESVRRLSPTIYKFDTIHIKENGLLKVNDNGSKWLILDAKIIILEGSIEYQNFRRGLGTVVQTLNDGEVLEHTFVEAPGGAGGNGGSNGKLQGGAGYRPTDFNGGGGGSGAYYYGRPKQNSPGNAANDFRGAPSPGSSDNCFGGDGGRQTAGHGGVICLKADKIIFGPNSKINLKGANGNNGTNGGNGDCYGGGAVYYWGGGGSGGGTSGANGGVLIVRCNNIINSSNITVENSPGRGGFPGNPGTGGRCSGFSGQRGKQGDTGESGYVELP